MEIFLLSVIGVLSAACGFLLWILGHAQRQWAQAQKANDKLWTDSTEQERKLWSQIAWLREIVKKQAVLIGTIHGQCSKHIENGQVEIASTSSGFYGPPN